MDNETNQGSWTREPYYKRTPAEEALAQEMITAFMATRNCRYDYEGEVQITAQPKEFDKHNFTPVEKLTLDYEGSF